MNRFTREQLNDERKKVLVALGVAILIHLLFILSMAAALTFRLKTLPPPEEEKPIELTILDQPAPQANHDSYMETTEAQRTDKAPENPNFQSDKNTEAASELPAAGQAPVPTQDGEHSPFIEFGDSNYTAGRGPRPAPPAGAPAQPTQSLAQSTPPPPATPAETPKEAPTPRTTTQLALLEPPKAKEMPTPPPQPQAAPNPNQQPPQPITTQSQPSALDYKPQTRITRIRGDISNRGRSSVAANATPLGRYKKQLFDAIGSRWYYYVNEQIGLFNVGMVTVRFVVDANGKVTRFEVIRNTSNESFASCCASSVLEAEIPPIPKELLPMLEGERIETEYSFAILPN